MSGSQFRLVLQKEKTNTNRDNQRRRKAQAAAEPDLNSPVTEAEKKGRPPGQAALDWDVKRLETIAPCSSGRQVEKWSSERLQVGRRLPS